MWKKDYEDHFSLKYMDESFTIRPEECINKVNFHFMLILNMVTFQGGF